MRVGLEVAQLPGILGGNEPEVGPVLPWIDIERVQIELAARESDHRIHGFAQRRELGAGRSGRLRRGEDLERDFGEHAQSSQGADHQLRKVEPGGVLHHGAATANDLPSPIHETDPDEEVGHNWVLVKPGQEESVLANGIAAGDDRDWLDKDDPGIIAATKLIEGDDADEITFDAPAAGTYTFLCTFPDHYKGGMKGTLTIE